MVLPVGFIDSALSPVTLLMLGIVALLLFGERLPEVGRSWGKKLMELKKQVESIQNQIRSAAMSATPELPSLSGPSGSRRESEDAVVDREEATAPKFVPPPSEPTVEAK